MKHDDLIALLEICISRPILTRKDLARRYGRNLITIDRWHSTGKLPPAVYLPGCRFPLWRPGDIQRWENKKKK